MIVRDLNKARQTDRRITAETWESTRLLLKNDEMGFSFHITTIYAGTETEMCYLNHFEAVYCISGKGTLVSTAEGRTYDIEPGTMYALNEHDHHYLRAETELELACVFNPPLFGNETHGDDGAYPTTAETVGS